MDELALPIEAPAGAIQVRLAARPGSPIRIADQTIEFDLGDEASYVSTAGGRVTSPPPVDARIALEPGREHRLSLELERGGDGEVVLWVIEFAGARKLHQASRRIDGNQVALTWRTAPDHECALIALRLRGRGWLRIDRASVRAIDASAPAPVAAAAAERWIELAPLRDPAALAAALDRDGASRALVVDRAPHAFARVSAIAGRTEPRLALAVSPVELPARFDPDGAFAASQLELAWQQGRLDAVDLGAVTQPPPRAVLAWLERHQVAAVCRLRDAADAERIASHLLRAGSHPVIALVESTSDADRAWQSAWLHANPRLHSIDGGSIGALVDEQRQRRERALGQPAALAFPPLPGTADDCRAQGFEIVDPGRFDAAGEFDGAKQFWAEYGIRSWYQVDKPWTGWLARWVSEIAATRVLEFGCNVGRNLAGIRDVCPGVDLVGLDINAEAIAAGREHTGLDLRVADETSLAGFADGAFDAVFTVSVLDHMSDIGAVCSELLRVAARQVVLLEVRLPLEGRCVHHLDHKAGGVRASTGASYSWHVERFLGGPRVIDVAQLPVYLHSASLGPYYTAFVITLDPPPAR